MATAGRYIMAIADRYIIVTAGRDIIAVRLRTAMVGSSGVESLSDYRDLMRSAVPLALLFGVSPPCSALRLSWWAQVESNHRPRAYQARALTY